MIAIGGVIVSVLVIEALNITNMCRVLDYSLELALIWLMVAQQAS
jgi:hypothetical protein